MRSLGVDKLDAWRLESLVGKPGHLDRRLPGRTIVDRSAFRYLVGPRLRLLLG